MADPAPLRLGIWEPEQVGGSVEFVRSAASAGEWRLWADVERIPAKRGPRVALLGESVARGFLYDPVMTTARVLETMLAAMPGLDRASVVDLARSDIGGAGLQRLFGALPALEPDAIVLFAGNNWHSVLFRLERLEVHLQDLAGALRSGGFAAMRRVAMETIVLPHARETLDALAESARSLRIPVVLVAPAFNLRDWRSAPEMLAPVLRDGANLPWMEARREAEEACAVGRFDAVERRARTMIELDGGTSAYGHSLLAEALLGVGRVDAARASLEAARDAPYGLLVPHSPRCAAEVLEVLRAKAAEHGFAQVDLPRVFAEPAGVPDRRFLLDYCHLTMQGMRVAMAATARTLAPLLGGPELARSELEAVAPRIDPQDEAGAHLLAALHNAHWGQGAEVVRHHCRQAVERGPAGGELVLAYLDAQSRHADLWLCEAYERLIRPANVRRYMVLNDPRVLEKSADFELVEILSDELERAGIHARDRVESIVRAEHGRQHRVDLLEPRYRATTFHERAGRLLRPRPAYHQALDLSSCFYLVLDEPRPVTLTLTCRLPAGEGDVEVSVNGAALEGVSATRRWRTFELSVPAHLMERGVNRLALHWPLVPLLWQELLERGARRIERGIYPEALPTYGEVHTFVAAS